MFPLLVSVLIASPAPSPAPILKTIVTVKSSPFCGSFAAHVNAAIGSAVGNDQTLGTVIVELHSNDLAVSSLTRSRELVRLSALSSAIYKQFRTGEAEVVRLRDLAAKSTDPREKLEVKASADALGGALYRQHLLQRDLDGFVAYLYASDMRSNGGTDWHTPDPGFGQSEALDQASEPASYWVPGGYRIPSTVLAGQDSREDDVRMAAAAAGDFQARMPAILVDEMNAGSHIEQAGDHC